MLITYTPEGIICLIAVMFCMFAFLILLIFSQKGNTATLLLAASYFALGYGYLVMFLIYSRLIIYVPHLYRTGAFFTMLQIPLCYLYVRSVIKQTPLKWADCIHFIIPLIYVIDLGPFIFSSTANKLSIIQHDIKDLKVVVSFRQSWLFPPNVHIQARTIMAACYWFLQLNLLKRIKKEHLSNHNPAVLWLYIYNSIQLFIFLPGLFNLLKLNTFVWATSIPPAAASLLSVIALFMHPQILYGIKKTNQQQPVKTSQYLNEELIIKKKQLLDKLIIDDKVFLNSKYSLKDLSTDLEITPHQASALINQLTNTNLNNYLNQQRIQFCIELIRSEKIANLNLFGLAIKCGFNNRNTFTTAFKKFTGETPSGYLKLNKKNTDRNEE